MQRRHAFAGLALLAAALLCALGWWQVERRAWKHALVARIDARLAAPPVALPPPRGWTALARDGAYLRVRLVGRWRPAAPVFVQAVTVLGGGWWTLSPMQTPGGLVLVNRGFVPHDLRGRVTAPTGPAVVEGLLRLDEPGGGFLRNNDPAHDRWYSRDVGAITGARGWGAAAPFFVDANASPGAGWPRGGLTVVRFPDNHLLYAITWFALAGLAIGFAWRVARADGTGQK